MAKKVRAFGWVLGLAAIVLAAPLRAAEPGWQPTSFYEQLTSTLVYCGIGIVMAVVGFKLFDMVTPGKLDVEVCEKQNLAAGIMSAAVILGICIIIAAVVAG